MEDVVLLLIFGLFIAWFGKYVISSLLAGELKTKYGTVRQEEQPATFRCMAIIQIGAIVLLIYLFIDLASAL